MGKFLDNKLVGFLLDNSTFIFLYGLLVYYSVKQNKEYTFALIVVILLYTILGVVSRIERKLTNIEQKVRK